MQTNRIYYDDPYRTELKATVMSITDNGVILDQTICYPKGGGQAGDRGTIGGAPLLDTVYAKDGEIYHRVEKPSFVVGDEVAIRLDWKRRYHLMQSHSAQHIASGLLDSEFSIPTVSVHLGERVVMIECGIDTVDIETCYRLEELVNEQIRASLPITAVEQSRSEAEALGLRRTIKVESDQVRLVVVDSVDTIACGGLHVANTSEIELFLYEGQERIRGHARLRFTVGDVAWQTIRTNARLVDELGTLFSAPSADLTEVATTAVETAFEHRRELAVLRQELASRSLALRVQQAPVIDKVPLILWEVEPELPFKDIAHALDEYENLLLAASRQEGEEFLWLVGVVGKGSDHFDFHKRRTELLDGFSAKGGGRAPLFQGKGKGSAAAFLARFKELAL